MLLIKRNVKSGKQNRIIYTDKFCIFCSTIKEPLFHKIVQEIVIYTYQNEHNLLKVKVMDTKLLVNQFNLITKPLLAMTAARSEVAHFKGEVMGKCAQLRQSI